MGDTGNVGVGGGSRECRRLVVNGVGDRGRKASQVEKNSEWMDANTEPDQMTTEEKVAAKKRRERDLIWEHVQKHRALKKEQNPKPKKHNKNINEACQKQKTHIQFSNQSIGATQ
jgi:hypothetical protein